MPYIVKKQHVMHFEKIETSVLPKKLQEEPFLILIGNTLISEEQLYKKYVVLGKDICCTPYNLEQCIKLDGLSITDLFEFMKQAGIKSVPIQTFKAEIIVTDHGAVSLKTESELADEYLQIDSVLKTPRSA